MSNESAPSTNPEIIAEADFYDPLTQTYRAVTLEKIALHYDVVKHVWANGKIERTGKTYWTSGVARRRFDGIRECWNRQHLLPEYAD